MNGKVKTFFEENFFQLILQAIGLIVVILNLCTFDKLSALVKGNPMIGHNLLDT